MAAGDKQPKDQPFHIRLTGVADGPGFVHGVETEAQAKADAADRNKKAEAMGIKARYEVAAKA